MRFDTPKGGGGTNDAAVLPGKIPHFCKTGNAAPSQPGDAHAAGSEWFIRTMRRRRTRQGSSTAKLFRVEEPAVLLQPAVPFGNSRLPQERQNKSYCKNSPIKTCTVSGKIFDEKTWGW